ncbi:MAG: hypothetical protein ACI9C2_000185, partial [Gammaproteobacteria bacterium]
RRMDRPDRLDLEAIDAEAAALDAEIDGELESSALGASAENSDTNRESARHPTDA